MHSVRSRIQTTPAVLSTGCPLGSLFAAQRGTVFVEYIVVLVLVSAVGVAGIIPLGVALSRYFKAQQTVLSLPFP
jgi:Flp pilus assembly pilin Flp